MSKQFLLDENVDPRLRKALKRRFPEMVVWQVGDAGASAKGTLDPDILHWCEVHDFCLVTNNRASMPVHLREHLLAGHHLPGIFILNSAMSLGDTVAELGLIWELSTPDQYTDLINFLPVSK
jgi:hypothetical protein